MSKKEKSRNNNSHAPLIEKLRTLKPGGCVTTEIPKGSTFKQMYNILNVVINYAGVKPPKGHYFRKTEMANTRRVLIRCQPKEDMRGMKSVSVRRKSKPRPSRKPAVKHVRTILKPAAVKPLSPPEVVKAVVAKLAKAELAKAVDRREHALMMKRARQARYRANLKKRKAVAV